jgi:hypothetical protein
MASDEEIQKHYLDAKERGELGSDDELRVQGRRELVILPKVHLEVEQYQREKLEREIDEMKTALSMQWFEAHGYLENLIDPDAEAKAAALERAMAALGSRGVMMSADLSQRATIRKASTEYMAVRKPSSDVMQASPARSKVTAPASALRHRRKTFGSID